jgi:3-oxoacyl-[acyl-carrier-protein] synthase III
MSAWIVGTGSAVPERVIANEALGRVLGIEASRIEAASGIRERRWVSHDETASGLAVRAVVAALESARVSADEVDYLVGGTLSPDYHVPGIAPLVQRAIPGIARIPALDVRVGCAAILYELQLARALVEAGAAHSVVCFGAEAQSKGLDLDPRSAETSMLFGDGAGALVVVGERGRDPDRRALAIVDTLVETDGEYAEALCVRAPGTANGARWIDEGLLAANAHLPHMDGRAVILHAVRRLGEATRAILRRNGLTIGDVDLVVPHQANGNLLEALASRLGLDRERVVTNVARLGNTSGASAFIALDQAWREERLRREATVLVLAFGAGFTWGAALCRAV